MYGNYYYWDPGYRSEYSHWSDNVNTMYQHMLLNAALSEIKEEYVRKAIVEWNFNVDCIEWVDFRNPVKGYTGFIRYKDLNLPLVSFGMSVTYNKVLVVEHNKNIKRAQTNEKADTGKVYADEVFQR